MIGVQQTLVVVYELLAFHRYTFGYVGEVLSDPFQKILDRIGREDVGALGARPVAPLFVVVVFDEGLRQEVTIAGAKNIESTCGNTQNIVDQTLEYLF